MLKTRFPFGRACCCLISAAASVASAGEDRPVEINQASFDPADIGVDRLRWHIPDPDVFRPELTTWLTQYRDEGNKSDLERVQRDLSRLDELVRTSKLNLSLSDCIRRMLENNYGIQAQSFNPAIETTRVVEAEAEFDAVFFGSITKNVIDRPSGSQLAATNIDQFTSTYGVRKALSSGTQVSGFWQLDRQDIPLTFQTINPEWTSTFNLEVRQPFLRGAGIDFNRSQIHLAKNNRAISDWAYKRQVRDTLRDLEELYWRLVQARRDIAISSRLLGEFESIYNYLVARRDFDVIPVQLAATKARLEREHANFIRRRATVFDAEQRLLALMNDPTLPIGGDTELVPEDFPQLSHIMVDPFAEVQVALDNRAEIREQELQIKNAKIGVGRAENLELPRLDATFRYAIDGLSNKADPAFDQMTTSNFQSYFVTVEFEVPFGNRARRAATVRAKLQHRQAKKALEGQIEQIILDVHVAARELQTTFEQIGPSFESAESREREVASIVARAERKDLNTLNSELNAREALAAERRSMLAAMVDYNIAVADLERAKGTLLRYNNVVIPLESDDPLEGPVLPAAGMPAEGE